MTCQPRDGVRRVYVNDVGYFAYFHGWSRDREDRLVAVVEREDKRVMLIRPEYLQFVD